MLTVVKHLRNETVNLKYVSPSLDLALIEGQHASKASSKLAVLALIAQLSVQRTEPRFKILWIQREQSLLHHLFKQGL